MAKDDDINANEEEKIKKNKSIKTFFINMIISFIIVLIIGVLIYFKYFSLFTFEEISQIKEIYDGLGTWGIFGLGFAIIFFIMGIVTTIYYRKKYKAGELTKDVSKTIFFYLICAFSSFMVCFSLFQPNNLKYNFYIFILAFALCCIFFKLFSQISLKTFKQFTTFPLALIFRFFIPMLLVWIIFLGAINGLYNTESTFLNNIAEVFGSDQYISLLNGGSLGDIMGFICYKVISTIYLIGYNNPHSMLILCIVTTLFLLFLTIYKHFIKEVPAMSFADNMTEDEAKKLEENSQKLLDSDLEKDSDEKEESESTINLNNIINSL